MREGTILHRQKVKTPHQTNDRAFSRSVRESFKSFCLIFTEKQITTEAQAAQAAQGESGRIRNKGHGSTLYFL